MHVRTIYVTGDPAKVDDGVKAILGMRQEVSDLRGYCGMAVHADRDLGKVITSTWWESEDALRASDEALRSKRNSMIMKYAESMTIDNWEVAAGKPPAKELGRGAAFRLIRLDFDPSDADLMVETFTSTSMPRLETVQGLAGAIMLINRAEGRAQVGILYKDRKSMVAARATAASIRSEALAKAHVNLRSLEEFDTITADVRLS